MRCPLLYILCFLAIGQPVFSQHYRPANGPLTTPWTVDVAPENALPEYPRPQMERQKWLNLNGLWDFTMINKETGKTSKLEKILVPYPVESALSGIGKQVGPEQQMIYKRVFSVPADWQGQRILLHFGAVDWQAEVFVNSKSVGEHLGGYDPFSFDITDFLNKSGGQVLTVQVWDPTSAGGQPIGKQHLNPSGIWYTGSSGIWQTVWLEPVAEVHISRFEVEPDFDKKRFFIKTEADGDKTRQAKVTAVLFEDGKKVSESSGKPGTKLLLSASSGHAWTPSDPYLYNVEIILDDGKGKVLDKVKTYAGLRKISLGKDAKGFTRMLLNNEFVFQLGPLDQGFFPDGLYTPPTEKAMIFDLKTLKSLGFNMIRKHVKVEPDRWYYLCDKMGFLVWQDMPSAKNETSEQRIQFEKELHAMVKNLYNHPSIVMWVPFNEGWGQYHTENIVEQVRQLDNTRLVNNASGWTDMLVGDVNDIHSYPGPDAPKPEEDRATALGEFGGLGLNVAGHQWAKSGWGYALIQTPEALLERYEDLYRNLLPLVDSMGLSAAVYTQTSDVETENNGLLTYDRKVLKMDSAFVALAHQGYLPPKPRRNPRIFTKSATVSLATIKPGANMTWTIGDKKGWQPYTAPIILKKSATLTCRASWPNGVKSHEVQYVFTKTKPVKSKAPGGNLPAGLSVKMYDGVWDSLPDFTKLAPSKELTVNKIGLSEIAKQEDFGLVFEGWVEVPATGAYTFYCVSDDGSRLLVANQLLADNDGIHGMKEVAGTIALNKGRHPIRLEFFQKKGGKGLELWWEGETFGKVQIGEGSLMR